MHFTLPTICIVAPLLSLIPSATSSIIRFTTTYHPPPHTRVAHPVSLPSEIFIPQPTPLTLKNGAPEGLVLDANQEWAVKRMLDGTSEETIIGLEPWYWPLSGCCRVHWEEVIACWQGHKVMQKPPDLGECDRKRRIWESCRMNLGYSNDHQKWQTCYFLPRPLGEPPHVWRWDKNPPPGMGNGSRLIGPEDVAAMHCLSNLHFLQKFACIYLAGSSCPISPGGGENWITTGHLGFRKRISAECSRTFQAAQDSMLGLNVSSVKVVVAATHQNWKVSEQIIFWGAGNWFSICDKILDRDLWHAATGEHPVPGGTWGRGPEPEGLDGSSIGT